MLAPLDNEVVFKKAFTDKTVFRTFVHDIVGIDFQVNKIETEKKFSPKVGNIDFAYDIFAESMDHRVIVEMQRVEYDYHFDRFLHYHHMAIAELQRQAKDYNIKQVVYTVVILTAPYTIRTKDGIPVQDEVMVSGVDPRTLDGKVRELYGHKMIFLNPHYKDEITPLAIRDWMKLLYASIHNQNPTDLNQENVGIKKVIEMINTEKLSPVERRLIKEAEGKKRAMKIMEEEVHEIKAKLHKEKQRVEEAIRRAEEEKQRAKEEKQRAEEEKQRAEEAIQRESSTMQKAVDALVRTGMTPEKARKILGLE